MHTIPDTHSTCEGRFQCTGFLQDSGVTALQELSSAVIQGKLDFSSTMIVFVLALSKTAGLCASTAVYVVLRALGEPDAFPSADSASRTDHR